MAPSIVLVLPGETDEVMILNTHTDGQNFIEENGCVALIQLARHFATRPEDSGCVAAWCSPPGLAI